MAKAEVKNFSAPDEERPFEGNGRALVVNVGGQTVGRGTFEPGWKWSTNVKPIAGTESCQVSHLGYVLSGRMRVYMDDGSEVEVGPGDVVALNANPTVAHRLTGADPERVRAVAKTASSAAELPPAEDTYAELAEVLGVPIP